MEDVDVEDDEGAGEKDEGCQAAAENEQRLHRKKNGQKKKKKKKTELATMSLNLLSSLFFNRSRFYSNNI